ncbi:hypothetical protein AAG906_030633 [Vitis piasezkii]
MGSTCEQGEDLDFVEPSYCECCYTFDYKNLLQTYCNDQLCRDIGCNLITKSWFLSQLFSSYGPDYKNLARL